MISAFSEKSWNTRLLRVPGGGGTRTNWQTYVREKDESRRQKGKKETRGMKAGVVSGIMRSQNSLRILSQYCRVESSRFESSRVACISESNHTKKEVEKKRIQWNKGKEVRQYQKSEIERVYRWTRLLDFLSQASICLNHPCSELDFHWDRRWSFTEIQSEWGRGSPQNLEHHLLPSFIIHLQLFTSIIFHFAAKNSTVESNKRLETWL